MAITWAAVSRSLTMINPIPHFRFARLNLRTSYTFHIHPDDPVFYLCARPFSACPMPDRLSGSHILCNNGDFHSCGKSYPPEYGRDNGLPVRGNVLLLFLGCWLRCKRRTSNIPIGSSRLQH